MSRYRYYVSPLQVWHDWLFEEASSHARVAASFLLEHADNYDADGYFLRLAIASARESDRRSHQAQTVLRAFLNPAPVVTFEDRS